MANNDHLMAACHCSPFCQLLGDALAGSRPLATSAQASWQGPSTRALIALHATIHWTEESMAWLLQILIKAVEDAPSIMQQGKDITTSVSD